MVRPNATQMAWARSALASEMAAANGGEASAVAAGAVYDRLDAQLTSLLGALGFQALFARSARLTQDAEPTRREVAGLADSGAAKSSANLRAHLEALDEAAAAEAAEALFGTFFALMTTFIGERLTTQTLRRTWPSIEAVATETDK